MSSQQQQQPLSLPPKSSAGSGSGKASKASSKQAVAFADTSQMDSASLLRALHSAEAKARQAESRLAAVEKQLSMCRHSTSTLRAAAGLHAPPPPPPGAGASSSPTRRGGSPTGRLNADTATPNAAAAAACAEAVAWAMRAGLKQGLFPGLNASSPRSAFEHHLRLHDPASRCAEPPSAANAESVDDEYAEEDEMGRREAFASMLLLLGVVLCALCNAWALGYLQPSRRVRAVLQAVGIPIPQLVR